jgi:hypothetical protein
MKIREIETLADLKKVLPEIENEWSSLKNSAQFKFSEYTDEKIKLLRELVHSKMKNEMEILINIQKSFLIIIELDNKHFKGHIDLQDIFMDSNASERINYFIKYSSILADEEYWEKLSVVYQAQDYNPVPTEILSALFNSTRKGRVKLMNKEELNFYNNLPNDVDIYRAMSKKEFESKNYRFSWTLSEKKAKFFLDRNKLIYGDEMVIHKLQVNKKNILAYLNSREEEEIIYIE